VIRHLTGSDLELYQDQLAHAGLDDPFWSPLDYSDLLKDWTVPTLLVDGWHDYPLPRVLEDYAALRTSPPRSAFESAPAGILEGVARAG
jgi:predicted acyl esterase